MSHSNENRCCGDAGAAGLLRCYLTLPAPADKSHFHPCHDINVAQREGGKKNVCRLSERSACRRVTQPLGNWCQFNGNGEVHLPNL